MDCECINCQDGNGTGQWDVRMDCQCLSCRIDRWKDGDAPIVVQPGAPSHHIGSKKNDTIEHPPHYTNGNIECIDAIKAALTPEEFRGFCKGNALKYVWREKHKGQGQDLAKAQWYLSRLIATAPSLS